MAQEINEPWSASVTLTYEYGEFRLNRRKKQGRGSDGFSDGQEALTAAEALEVAETLGPEVVAAVEASIRARVENARSKVEQTQKATVDASDRLRQALIGHSERQDELTLIKGGEFDG